MELCTSLRRDACRHGRSRLAGTALKRLGGEHRQPPVRTVAVHLLDIELAHELDDLRAHQLHGHQDGEPRRIGDDEPSGDERPARLERSGGVSERYVFRDAIGEGAEERRSHVALPDNRAAERGMETAEVGQWRELGRDRPDPGVEEPLLLGPDAREPRVKRGGLPPEAIQQERERSPRHTDGRVHEYGVDGGVINLHAELFHQYVTELETVLAGERGIDGQPRGIEYELILVKS